MSEQILVSVEDFGLAENEVVRSKINEASALANEERRLADKKRKQIKYKEGIKSLTNKVVAAINQKDDKHYRKGGYSSVYAYEISSEIIDIVTENIKQKGWDIEVFKFQMQPIQLLTFTYPKHMQTLKKGFFAKIFS